MAAPNHVPAGWKVYQPIGSSPELHSFLFGVSGPPACVFYLPQFRGRVQINQDDPTPAPLTYAGRTLSLRDTVAAFNVASLVGRASESLQLTIETANEFDSLERPTSQTVFFFGSKSNRGTQWVTNEFSQKKFFEFAFGSKWEIRCKRGGGNYSIPDPSGLNESSYAKQKDYGVIARFVNTLNTERYFVLAGLGSRATEGCGYYFAQNWKTISAEAEELDFAYVLEFPPHDALAAKVVKTMFDRDSSENSTSLREI